MAMHVGVVTMELAIYESTSLKDKRRVLKSLKDRVRETFNAAIAEVDHQDARQRATLAVAMVSSDSRHLHSGLDQVVDFVRRGGGSSLLTFEKEVF